MATLSSAESVGRRKNCWKTKPMWRERNAESWLSSRSTTASPATRTAPCVGRSSVPPTESMVVFPDPEGPAIATNSPRSTRSET